MSAYFQPEELSYLLDQLIGDPHREEVQSRRFREVYPPFDPVHFASRSGGERDVKMSDATETAHVPNEATLLPSMATAPEPSDRDPSPVGAEVTDEAKALANDNTEQPGLVTIAERVKLWRRSSCHWPFPSAPMAEEASYAASVDQLEVLTEIATSCKGSMNGDGNSANGDIEIHGTRTSPVPQQPQIRPAKQARQAKKSKRAKKAQKGRGRKAKKHVEETSTSKTPEKNTRSEFRYGPSRTGSNVRKMRELMLKERRRSARIAAIPRTVKKTNE